jgi:aminoglycoside phosphotransferase (APT) family kinase protein
MEQPWEADVEIDESVAAGLIDRQFPELAPADPAPFGNGWDNAAFLVGGRLVFRFPRRLVAAHLMEHEIRILPMLAPRLPLRITAPQFVGEPEDDYPYRFAGYERIEGQTACRAAPTDAERMDMARPLAEFLHTLHSIPIDDETLAWAPGDEIGRTDLPRIAAKIAERLCAQASMPPGVDLEEVVALASHLADRSRHFGPVRWVHGDLYARHLILDDRRRLIGIIDWGDVHLGDPALDLSVAWSYLPPAARAAFREAYGPISEAAWDRARFRALHYGAVLIEYGATRGDDPIRAVGEDALRFALAGD